MAVEPLTLKELLDPKIRQALARKLQDIVTFNDVRSAFNFVRNLGASIDRIPNFAASNPDVSQDYQDMLTDARWVALPLLPNPTVLDLMKNALRVGLGFADVVVEDKVTDKLLNILVYEERDELKKLIQQALLQSSEEITEKSFTLEGRLGRGTAAHWLQDYLRAVGTGPLDRVKRAEYFTRNPNFTKLDNAEKGRVARLLDLYEFLRHSSLTPEGLEEAIPIDDADRTGKILHGVFEPLRVDRDLQQGIATVSQVMKGGGVELPAASLAKPKVSPPSPGPVAQLMSRYEAFLKAQERLRPIEERIRAETKGDFRKLKQTMGAGITGKDRDRVVVCLRLLARSADLVRVLEREQAVIKTLTDHLVKKYSATPGVEQALRVLSVNPVSPEAVSEFLQYVLKQRLGLTEEESALIAVELGMLLAAAGKPDFQHLAYADSKTRTFAWIANRIEGGRFVREAS